MGENGLSGREVALKALEKLLPAFGYIYAAHVGLITANVIVLATWIVSRVKGRKVRSLDDAKMKDSMRLIELSYAIDEKRARIRELKRQLGEADERRRSIIEAMVKMEEESLEKLLEEQEITQLRLIAIEKLKSLGDRKLIRNVEKVIADIQEGRLDKSQYEILSQLEDLWRRRQLEAATLRRIIEGG